MIHPSYAHRTPASAPPTEIARDAFIGGNARDGRMAFAAVRPNATSAITEPIFTTVRTEFSRPPSLIPRTFHAESANAVAIATS